VLGTEGRRRVVLGRRLAPAAGDSAEAHGVVWTLKPEHVSVDARPVLRSTGKLDSEHALHTPAGRAVEHEATSYFHSGG
jgi:hypothetical protein